MNPSGVPVKILVLPIFRRHWCFHAIEDVQAAQRVASEASNIQWRKGANLEEKLSLLGTKISSIAHGKVVSQWRSLESAADGTIKNRIFRLAQAVLSREDSDEAFLKAVPALISDIEIIYPASLKESLVRRRLRHLVGASTGKFRCRLALWASITAPLIPLFATPVPAFPVYYTGWRTYSNFQALSGAKALADCWSVRDTEKLIQLQKELAELQAGGLVFPPDSWPAKLLSKSPRYLDILENPEQKVMRFYKRMEPSSIVPRMTASSELDALASPSERLGSPIGDDAIISISKCFGAPALLQHVAKARKQATGSMFPTQLSS
jgi:hypothetical protein